MGSSDNLEARLQSLEKDAQERKDIEAIKRVKYRYWRCLDLNVWEELATCFTEDAQADYGPKIKLSGRTAILDFLRTSLVQFKGVHHGHNPEIDLTGAVTAKGTWALYNFMIYKETGSIWLTGGMYYDDYTREEGSWKIKSTREVNVFRKVWDEPKR